MNITRDEFEELKNRITAVEIRMTHGETRMTDVETRMTHGETRMTDVETRMTDVETRMTHVETYQTKIANALAKLKKSKFYFEDIEERNWLIYTAETYLKWSRKKLSKEFNLSVSQIGSIIKEISTEYAYQIRQNYL